jgi:hypothetical protein
MRCGAEILPLPNYSPPEILRSIIPVHTEGILSELVILHILYGIEVPASPVITGFRINERLRKPSGAEWIRAMY